MNGVVVIFLFLVIAFFLVNYNLFMVLRYLSLKILVLFFENFSMVAF